MLCTRQYQSMEEDQGQLKYICTQIHFSRGSYVTRLRFVFVASCLRLIYFILHFSFAIIVESHVKKVSVDLVNLNHDLFKPCQGCFCGRSQVLARLIMPTQSAVLTST